jgi:hypothetical protein
MERPLPVSTGGGLLSVRAPASPRGLVFRTDPCHALSVQVPALRRENREAGDKSGACPTL